MHTLLYNFDQNSYKGLEICRDLFFLHLIYIAEVELGFLWDCSIISSAH